MLRSIKLRACEHKTLCRAVKSFVLDSIKLEGSKHSNHNLKLAVWGSMLCSPKSVGGKSIKLEREKL